MFNLIQDLKSRVLAAGLTTQRSAKIFSSDDSPVMDYTFESINFNDQEELGEFFRDQLRALSNGELQCEKIRYCKNGFGFPESGYDTFCHAKRLVGTEFGFEYLCANQVYFIIHSVEGEKGLWATWFCPADDTDDACRSKLLPAMEAAMVEMARDQLRDKYYAEQERIRKQKYIEALTALGITSEPTKIVNSERDTYGGHKDFEYIFPEAITEEQFKEFLRLNHEVVEAKPCPYPICHEQVSIMTRDNITWHYVWSGEWSD